MKSVAQTLQKLEHFEGFEVELSNNSKGTFSIATEKEEVPDSTKSIWWIHIYSNEFRSGVDTPEIDLLLSELGWALYKHLKAAPYFRFALVGLEVTMAFSFKDFPSLLNNPSNVSEYQGLVLSNQQVLGTKSENLFTSFTEEHQWIPYAGNNL